MNPRMLAHALSDLVRDRVIAANEYLGDWASLIAAGCPESVVMHALDLPTRGTLPLAAVRRWGGRGLLGLHGGTENGKTHAVAVWAVERRRRGLPTVWINAPALLTWTALDSALERATKAPAVVLDEVGPGLWETESAQAKLESFILARDQRPTIITSNANRAQLETVLGARVISRLKQRGDLHEFQSGDMRRDDSDLVDANGRSKRHKKANWVVGVFGCERDGEGWRVGDGLTQHLARCSRPMVDELRRLASRFGVPWCDVERRAVELDAERAHTTDWLEECRRALQTALAQDVNARKMQEIVELAAKDLERDRQIAQGSAIDAISIASVGPRVSWADSEDAVQRMRAMGYRVKPSNGGVDLVFKPKVGKPSVLAVGVSRRDAWDLAARQCGMTERIANM